MIKSSGSSSSSSGTMQRPGSNIVRTGSNIVRTGLDNARATLGGERECGSDGDTDSVGVAGGRMRLTGRCGSTCALGASKTEMVVSAVVGRMCKKPSCASAVARFTEAGSAAYCSSNSSYRARLALGDKLRHCERERLLIWHCEDASRERERARCSDDERCLLGEGERLTLSGERVRLRRSGECDAGDRDHRGE